MSGPTQKYRGEQYRGERYLGEPPIPFVDEITGIAKEKFSEDAKGLYIGCGNGRNFIQLIDNGLNLLGIDYSGNAIKQIIARRPDLRRQVRVEDFREFEGNAEFDYAIALQVFQHGSVATARENFARTHEVLKPGGLFFLRVNSVGTQIDAEYRIEGTEDDRELGGFSARYTGKDRLGKLVHFFTREELEDIAHEVGFVIVAPLHEVEIPRHDEAETHWSQWESVWQTQ